MTDFLEPKYPDSDSDVLRNMILAMNIHVPHSHPLPPGSSVHSFDTDSDSNSSAGTELSHSFSSSTTSQPHSPVWVESSDITRENTLDSATSNGNFQTLRGVGLGFNNGPSSVFNTIHRMRSRLITTIPFAMEQMHPHMTANSGLAPHTFVFVQLGLLWSFTGDWEKARQGHPNDDKRGRWKPSGFAVVVRLSPKGKPGELYVLHHPNAKPELKKFEDDLVGERKSRKNKKKTTEPGVFLKSYNPGHPHPKSDSSFWIAKIANSIQELGSYERKFEFDVVSSNKFHIVNAKIWNYGLDGPPLIPVREPEEIDS
jgi:hypothetical protein